MSLCGDGSRCYPLRFPKPYGPLTTYFRYYIPQVLARAEHIICNSTATARDITHLFGIPAAKITSIPLAYDADRFRPLDLPTTESQQPTLIFSISVATNPIKTSIAPSMLLPFCLTAKIINSGSPDQGMDAIPPN